MAEKTKRDIWHAIEGKYLGQCRWQIWLQGRKTLIEGMEHRDTGHTIVVEKNFERRVPTRGSDPWPDYVSVNVYAPIDRVGVTWTDLEAALAAYRA